MDTAGGRNGKREKGRKCAQLRLQRRDLRTRVSEVGPLSLTLPPQTGGGDKEDPFPSPVCGGRVRERGVRPATALTALRAAGAGAFPRASRARAAGEEAVAALPLRAAGPAALPQVAASAAAAATDPAASCS